MTTRRVTRRWQTFDCSRCDLQMRVGTANTLVLVGLARNGEVTCPNNECAAQGGKLVPVTHGTCECCGGAIPEFRNGRGEVRYCSLRCQGEAKDRAFGLSSPPAAPTSPPPAPEAPDAGTPTDPPAVEQSDAFSAPALPDGAGLPPEQDTALQHGIH